MEPDFQSLIVFAEIGVAFVAFSTIVAALQPIRGKPFTKFQVLLVHFYIESGSMNVGLALLPIVLWQFFGDEETVWRLATLAILILTSIYLVTYVVRRRRVRAPTPLPSLIVMLGYGVFIVLMFLTVSEKFWPPSMAIYLAYLLWGLISSAIIFIYFFSSFIKRSAGRMRMP